MSRTRGRWTIAAAAFGLAALFVVLGPRTHIEERWVEPTVGTDVDGFLADREAGIPGIRAGEEKAVMWADPEIRERTRVALVYLHGFSADRHEVDPMVQDLAVEFGANVFFTRLSGHGRAEAAMADATVEAWMDDAAEAVAVGEALGDIVILVGTSTGATLAVWAAARPEAAGRVFGLVLVSPNFQPKDRSSRMLLWPWGGWLARMVVGEQRCFEPANEAQDEHWTTCYPTSALLPMMALVEYVRTMPLETVSVPTLVAMSDADQVVDPFVTREVFDRLGSERKLLLAVDGTDDPTAHVLAGDIMSPSTTDGIVAAIVDFLAPELAEGSRSP